MHEMCSCSNRRRLGQSLASRLGWLGETWTEKWKEWSFSWNKTCNVGNDQNIDVRIDESLMNTGIKNTDQNSLIESLPLWTGTTRPGLTHDFLPRGPSARPQLERWNMMRHPDTSLFHFVQFWHPETLCDRPLGLLQQGQKCACPPRFVLDSVM